MTNKTWTNVSVGQTNTEALALPVWQIRALRRGLIRSCLNCDNFNEATEGCAKAQGNRPPALVIVLGCDQWIEDIPF